MVRINVPQMIWASDIVSSLTDCIPTSYNSTYTIYLFQAFSDSELLIICTPTFETAPNIGFPAIGALNWESAVVARLILHP